MTSKSKFLNSVKLAVAGLVVAGGVSSCSKTNDKHFCGAKNGCASKENTKAEKESCSAKKGEKAKCAAAKEEKAKCASATKSEKANCASSKKAQ